MRTLTRTGLALLALTLLCTVWVGEALAAPLDGVVYDARSGQPIAGVRVQVFYDASDPSEPGELVPAARLPAGQQSQRSAADGHYEFELPEGRIYQLRVTSRADSYSFPSTIVAPESGFSRFGDVSPDRVPARTGERRFYMRFDATLSNARFHNNHIALDAAHDVVDLQLEASRNQAGIADLVGFVATLHNGGERALSAAEGHPAYLLVTLPRGLSVNLATSTAEIELDGRVTSVRSVADRVSRRSDRLVRFGPFDVAPGAALRVRFQTSVGVDRKTGQVLTRIVAQDQGGVQLSSPTSATVFLDGDRDFSTSIILGRVFCDSDGDGEQGGDEDGVFGARIYADTGAIASSDAHGRFHFTRILPGSHVFKLDTASIPGSKLPAGDKRLLQLSEGLPMSMSFPVHCASAWVSSEHARVVLPLALPESSPADAATDETSPLLVRGRLSPMTLEIDGQRQDLPSIDLKLDVPSALLSSPASATSGPALVAVPPGGYAGEAPDWSLTWTDAKVGRPVQWRFTIERVEAGGLAPVFHRDGKGAPPAVVGWNGLNDAGVPVSPGIHVARMTLVSELGIEAASRREPFGIGTSQSSTETIVVAGSIFGSGAKALEPSSSLRTRAQEVVRLLGPDGQLDIAVHSDGRGDRLKALVQTQKEAQRIQELFVELGIDAARLSAHGRGAAEPIDDSKSAEAGQKNRRVVLAITRAQIAKVEVPLSISGKSELRINGRLTPVDVGGGFTSEIPHPKNKWLTVDMLAPTGRRVAFKTQVSASSGRAAGSARVTSGQGAIRTWQVKGDLAGRSLEVDFDKAPEGLWTGSATLATVDSLPIPEILTEGKGASRDLSSPMDFQLAVSDAISVRRWTMVVADETAQVVHRQGGEGKPPAIVRWDGKEGEQLLLSADQRYSYWLEVETLGASSFASAPRWFYVDPKISGHELEREGRLFSKNGSPRAALRNKLSQFAARAARAQSNERFLLVVEVAGDTPRVDSVRAALVSYLTSLGLAAGRYDLSARERTGTLDRVSIVRDRRPPALAAKVRVNGSELVLKGSEFSTSVELAEGEPVVVELTTDDGAHMRFVTNASEPSRRDSSGGELIAPTDRPSLDAQLSDEQILASDTQARSLRVLLPPKNQVLQDSKLALIGYVEPGVRVKINNREVEVAASGEFLAVSELPVGKSEITIRADDDLGGSSTIRWPLQVASTHSVVVGHVEGIAATAYSETGWSAESASIAGMLADSTLQLGPVLLSARAQAFVKARVPGGAFADSIHITAQVDTAREKSGSALFSQVVDPLRSMPVLGDHAEEVQDANTRGKVYARVEAGDSGATIGSVHTRLEGGGELFEYQRSADGAVAEVRKSVGNSDVAVRGFATTGAMSSARDVNWFRATGGTLFYLRHGYLVEGSEKVRIVVRDRDSGLELDEVALEEGTDYSIDYLSGRVRLSQPLSGTSASTWVLDNMNASATPMSGNLVYLNVSYEHEDQDGLAQRARGAYASTTIENRLSVGAGIVSEERDRQEDYRLMGADASLNIGEKSNLRAEVAASRQRDAIHVLSMDGGLSFGELQRDLAFNGKGSELQLAFKVSADFAVADWTDAHEFQDTSLSLYFQNLERGFASGDSVLDQGRLKFGGRMQHRLSDIDMILVRHEGQIAQVPRVGPALDDVMANPLPLVPDEAATYMTSIQWARDDARWHYKLEGMHQRISSTSALADGSAALDARRLGVGALTAYDYSDRVILRVGQQLVANTAEADPILQPITSSPPSLRGAEPLAGVVTNVGGDLQLAPDLSMTGDLFQRWNGDNAARVGFKSALSERGAMYVQEQIGGVDGRLSNATIVGAEDRFGEDGGGRSYGEYQMGHGPYGNRDRAVMGLGRRYQVTRHAGLGLGFEHQQAFGGYLPDGTSIGDAQRNVLHGSATYRRKGFRLAGQLELRLDNGDQGVQADEAVLNQDPREGLAPGGFADHGGVAPGAALVIAPGVGTHMLGGLTSEWRFHQEHSALARLRSSLSFHEAPGASEAITQAKFTELTTGWAYRPLRHDRFEMLTRYSYLMEQRPLALGDVAHVENSHVLALLPFARLASRVLLSGKLAVKRTLATDIVPQEGRKTNSVNAVLALVRGGYQFYGKWDGSAEVRQLALFGEIDNEWKLGSLLELGYSLSSQLRMAAGYNFGHFSDDELSDLKRDSHGLFMRITGMF